MAHFPADAPRRNVLRAFESLVFRLVREKEHISMIRDNPDGTKTPLTLPHHAQLKAATLRTICTRAGITRDEFLKAYEKA